MTKNHDDDDQQPQQQKEQGKRDCRRERNGERERVGRVVLDRTQREHVREVEPPHGWA